jgi:hypothetical protein
VSTVIDFFVAPDDTSAAMTEVGEPRTVADRDEDEWVDPRARDGEVFDPRTAHGIVGGPAAPAGSARRREQGVYCRVG